MADRLSDEQIAESIPEGWEREGEEIVRTFEFEEYLDGVEFAVRVGEIAEERFHHPEIVIGYGTVEVQFTTHEASGITENDINMAELVNDAR